MNALLFLARREFINSIKELFRRPSKLLVYAFVGVMFFYSVVKVNGLPLEAQEMMDLRMLHGIYLGVLFLLCLPLLFNSLQNGTTFFHMSDVTYLFVAPISPKKILAYGMTKQMGGTLFTVVFFVFYGAVAVKQFGVDWCFIALMLLGVAAALFLVQVTGLLFYTFTNGHPARSRAIKGFLYLILGGTACFILALFLSGGSGNESLLQAVSSPYLELIPLIGWMKGLVFHCTSGGLIPALAYGGALLLILALEFWIFLSKNVDYFEDVLESTESTYQMTQAMKNNSTTAAAAQQARSRKPAKVTVTGLRHGFGANTFFFRHICEMRRRSPILFVGPSTLVLLAASLIFCYVVQYISATEGETLQPGVLLVITTGVLSYLLFMRNANGNWVKELARPYLYLAPAGAFQKLFWACMTTILTPVVEGLLIFLVVGIALAVNPFTILICILLYSSVGFLFTAGNVLSQRLFGGFSNRGAIMMFTMLIYLFLFLPGVLGSVFVIAAFGGSAPSILAGLPCVIWNTGASLGIFALCRNLLETAEMG